MVMGDTITTSDGRIGDAGVVSTVPCASEKDALIQATTLRKEHFNDGWTVA
jgi:hypothetical protein